MFSGNVDTTLTFYHLQKSKKYKVALSIGAACEGFSDGRGPIKSGGGHVDQPIRNNGLISLAATSYFSYFFAF